MFPGCAGAAETDKQLFALEPQELFAFTQIFPVPVKLLPNVTVMEVPELLVIVTPDGFVHV